MQTLIGMAVSDVALLKAFAEGHQQVLDVTSGLTPGERGTWGVGFCAHGEMLVRKGPLSSLREGGVAPHLRDIRARHVLLFAETSALAKKLEDCSPLRYRDWLFAATGTETLGPSFAETVQAKLPTYAFSTRRHPGADEAVMMLIMAALERANARDTRDLTTRAIQRAVGVAAGQLLEIGGPDIAMLAMLHVSGHLFAFSLGRPLWMTRFRGTGDAARAGRLPRHEHLRALVIGDRTGVGNWEELPAGLGVEVDSTCEIKTFPIGPAAPAPSGAAPA